MDKLVGHKESTEKEIKNRKEFYELFNDIPIPENEILNNLGLFINRQNWSRILFLHELNSHY